MSDIAKWRNLGHRHAMWELLRYFLHLRSEKQQQSWLDSLKNSNSIGSSPTIYDIDNVTAALLLDYLSERGQALTTAITKLRTEDEARDYCNEMGIVAGNTLTRNKDHHQSSKALVATVSHLSKLICHNQNTTVDTNPQRRCTWITPKGIHVSSRNLDGAAPSTSNPIVIWEIKEYWGKTAGGSKMSDAVYECNLVGRELRDVEKEIGRVCEHVVFVDGKEQWSTRKSDLARIIDLHHQGLIDHLIVGKDVETVWPNLLEKILQSTQI